jgi:hypothetical protein
MIVRRPGVVYPVEAKAGVDLMPLFAQAVLQAVSAPQRNEKPLAVVARPTRQVRS